MRSTVAALAAISMAVALYAGLGVADEHRDDARPHDGERTWHILKDLPLDAASYQPAAAELVNAGVPEKFGHAEWATVVLTNEVHQHVGIYTILGAKMGVRAAEILQAPPRSVNVTMKTGGDPPLSCTIDGLQVALGSTFAQNLIHAPVCETPRVAAVFEYKGRKVRLSLKREIQEKVSEFIAIAVKECGNLTPAYFEQVESFSYRVWAEFDRKKIFDEEP